MIYLGWLVRTTVSLHKLINNKILLKEEEKNQDKTREEKKKEELADKEKNKEKCVNEIGIYGIILSDDTQVHMNKTAGYLVRTKNVGSNEGGVVMGFSAIDVPYLVEG